MSDLNLRMTEAGFIRPPTPPPTRYEKSVNVCLVRGIPHAFLVSFDDDCHGVYRLTGDGRSEQIGDDYTLWEDAEDAATRYNEVAAGIGVATGDWPL